jgi:7,8-dihydroneopterin aldolase/epimerase/oxygenase
MACSDRVFLEGLVFYAYHGVNPEENILGQRFVVDVSLTRDLRAAGESDDIARTTSYSAVYKQVREIVESGPYRLIETVAEKIVAGLLDAHPAVEAVSVRVRKPDVPIKGSIFTPTGGVGVEISQSRARSGP